jgi:hypothetical protein
MIRAVICGLAGFFLVTWGWVWRLTRPWLPDKSTGVDVFTYGLLLDPLFWALALLAAFGDAKLYLVATKKGT